MENIMMLPASYCVMNEEEMTYTTGGASAIQAIAAWVLGTSATGIGLVINAAIILL